MLASGQLPGTSLGEWPLSNVRLLAPIPDPGTIYAIGLNYAEHIAETGGTAPEQPIVFVKVAGSVAPPGGPIRCPEVVRRLDYEGELTIVIGAGGAIGGYCIADDVTARDLQRREPQWTRAKGADTFCPFGPWITTAVGQLVQIRRQRRRAITCQLWPQIIRHDEKHAQRLGVRGPKRITSPQANRREQQQPAREAKLAGM